MGNNFDLRNEFGFTLVIVIYIGSLFVLAFWSIYNRLAVG